MYVCMYVYIYIYYTCIYIYTKLSHHTSTKKYKCMKTRCISHFQWLVYASLFEMPSIQNAPSMPITSKFQEQILRPLGTKAERRSEWPEIMSCENHWTSTQHTGWKWSSRVGNSDGFLSPPFRPTCNMVISWNMGTPKSSIYRWIVHY